MPHPHSTFTLDLPPWFQHRWVLAYLGRDPQSPSERVDGRTVYLADGGAPPAENPTAITVELHDAEARCQLDAPRPLDAERVGAIRRRIRRQLGLVIDPTGFEARAGHEELVARLIGDRRGLSIPQTANVFDGLVWVVVGQQVSLAVAFSLRRRLTRTYGTRLDHSAIEDLWATPRPETVAGLHIEDLRRLSFSQRKAEYLLDLARAVVDGSLDLDALHRMEPAQLEETLLARRGLGPWSVHYLMMRAFGLPDCVPVGDAALRRNLKRFFQLPEAPDKPTVLELMEVFAPHRSLATFHLWALDKQSQ